MITTIWKHVNDSIPKQTGYYLAYKMSTLGDDSEGFGLYYWSEYHKVWRESIATHSYTIQVSIWSILPEHDPDNYQPIRPTVAEIDAWKNVQDAVDKYNMIKELVR